MSHWPVSNIKATNNLPFAFFSRLGFQVPLLIISAMKKVSVKMLSTSKGTQCQLPFPLSPTNLSPEARSSPIRCQQQQQQQREVQHQASTRAMIHASVNKSACVNMCRLSQIIGLYQNDFKFLQQVPMAFNVTSEAKWSLMELPEHFK